jgi:hypothetical protein
MHLLGTGETLLLTIVGIWLGLAVCDDAAAPATAVVTARASSQYAMYIETAELMSAVSPVQKLFAHDVKKLDTVTDRSARHMHSLQGGRRNLHIEEH